MRYCLLRPLFSRLHIQLFRKRQTTSSRDRLPQRRVEIALLVDAKGANITEHRDIIASDKSALVFGRKYGDFRLCTFRQESRKGLIEHQIVRHGQSRHTKYRPCGGHRRPGGAGAIDSGRVQRRLPDRIPITGRLPRFSPAHSLAAHHTSDTHLPKHAQR